MSTVAATRARGWLALLGCLGLAVGLALATPDPAQDARRRWADADVGAWAVTPDVSARVGQVRVLRAVDRGYGDPFTSAQALVVVTVDAEVRHRVVDFSVVWLRTRTGVEYAPRDEFVSAGLTQTQPGFTRHATLVFEVPPDSLDRATFLIDADGAAVDVYADAVRVDLGLRGTVPVSPETATLAPSTLTTT